MRSQEVNKRIVKVLFSLFRDIAECEYSVEQLQREGTRKNNNITGKLIGYQDLAESIGFPGLKRHLGLYLLILGDWCEDNGLPKLNALVVRENAETPGEGYPGGLEQWYKDLLEICNGRKNGSN